MELNLGLQILDMFIKLKLNINNNDSIKYNEDTFAKILVFIISYNEEIYLIYEIFFTLYKYLGANFFENLKKIITNKEVKYDINDTIKINESFFIIFESIIKCIFIYEKYNEIDENIFYEYFNSIKKILNDAKQMYYKLKMHGKEIYSLEILINILTTYNSCKNKKRKYDIKEIFSLLIKNISSENNFNSLLNILNEILDKESNEKKYYFLLNSLFISRYNKYSEQERKNIIDIFIKGLNNNHIKYILPILKILFTNVEPKNMFNPDNEQEYLNSFKKNFNVQIGDLKYDIYKIIVDKNNDLLYLNILYYFENECNIYFKKISKGKKINQIKESELKQYINNIIGNLSLKYFNIAINYYLDDSQINLLEGPIKKIGKLYCLAYIKIYLEKLSEFIINNVLDSRSANYIYNILLCKENNIKIYSLKIFFFKCIFRKSNMNYLDFLNFIRQNRFINLLKHDNFEAKFDENKNKHSYNYSFLNITNFEVYNKLSNMIDINVSKIEQQKEYKNIKNGINLELIYNILINKFIFDLYGNNNSSNLGEKANLLNWAEEKKIIKKKIQIHGC